MKIKEIKSEKNFPLSSISDINQLIDIDCYRLLSIILGWDMDIFWNHTLTEC